jgi:protein O-mannosyl-transferase
VRSIAFLERPSARMTSSSNHRGAKGTLLSVVRTLSTGSPRSQESRARRFLRQPSPLLLALPLVFALAAYGRVLGGGFVFDDRSAVRNLAVKNLAAQVRAFIPALFSGGRPVVDLSLALNYAANGPDGWGFHAVNIALHLATALLVFAFTVRVFEIAGVSRARGPALVVAGVFALHPLQSQAVSYVSQRAESLASALYLATLLLLLAAEDAASTPRRWLFWAGAYGTFLFGLGTKQIVVTVPLAYLLLTIAVPEKEQVTARISWPSRLAVLAPFLATAGWFVHQLMASVEGRRDVGAAVAGMTPWTYFLTQWKVVVIYLRLVFWPAGQCLDWSYPVTPHFDAATILSGIGLAVIGSGALALLWRFRGEAGEGAAAARISGFGVLWFFLLLAPTSSFVPIVDVLVEHRVYLASWGIFAAAVMMVERTLARLREKRRRIMALSLLSVVWGTLALCLHSRNRVWQDPVALWTDVVTKAPGNARGHVLLAAAYQDRGDLEQAVPEYGMALKVAASHHDIFQEVYARLGLGAALVDLGRIDDGIAVIAGGLARDPPDPQILAGLSEAWWHRGDQVKAESFAERALAAKPDLGNALLVLGAARKARGDIEGAVDALTRAVRADPDGAISRLTLASAYAKLGRTGEACGVWRDVFHLPAASSEDRARAFREASGSGCPGL